MNIKYDRVADAVYVSLDKGVVSKTLEMSERINVDVDKKGNVLGIEILDASNQQRMINSLKRKTKTGVPVEIMGMGLVAA